MEKNSTLGNTSSRTHVSNVFAISASIHVQQMLDAHMLPAKILARLVNEAEAISGPGTTVSILVLDQHGLLRNGASPNLPSDYLEAINGLKPDPRVGTCAAAAATGCIVL